MYYSFALIPLFLSFLNIPSTSSRIFAGYTRCPWYLLAAQMDNRPSRPLSYPSQILRDRVQNLLGYFSELFALI